MDPVKQDMDGAKKVEAVAIPVVESLTDKGLWEQLIRRPNKNVEQISLNI